MSEPTVSMHHHLEVEQERDELHAEVERLRAEVEALRYRCEGDEAKIAELAAEVERLRDIIREHVRATNRVLAEEESGE